MVQNPKAYVVGIQAYTMFCRTLREVSILAIYQLRYNHICNPDPNRSLHSACGFSLFRSILRLTKQIKFSIYSDVPYKLRFLLFQKSHLSPHHHPTKITTRPVFRPLFTQNFESCKFILPVNTCISVYLL